MTPLERFKENWIQPLFFLGNNSISLIGVGLTTAAALTLIGFWVIDVFGHGGSPNPYVGIIFVLFLPAIFVLGLLLIPIGIWWRKGRLRKTGQLPSSYPKVNLANPTFRRALNFVILATFINFVIVGTASYRGVAYMDKPSFCGQVCHVMTPQWNAYHVAPHASVACTECHVVSGLQGYVHAKLNGTRQLVQVVTGNYSRPIMAEGRVPPARATCVKCHNPSRYIGDKLVVKTSFGDDENNSVTHSLVLLHVGGHDVSGRLSGIHGAHLGHIEFIATDTANQNIPWVAKVNNDGSVVEFVSSDAKQPVNGEKRLMDCIDCHSRPAHSFETAEGALNRSMAQGRLDRSLPFLRKQGLALLKTEYTSQEEAESKISSGLEDFYRAQHPDVWNQKRAQIEDSARGLIAIYNENVFPFMKVTWGTYPNNIGHTSFPGCFRCH
ncbi:MAG TPA: NapC/NirT family cytochrome c, partial [Pseudacidobacterium sp.]|nr:NapC/NirT family cytochrome c [Pseudacidobacterium sp.]